MPEPGARAALEAAGDVVAVGEAGQAQGTAEMILEKRPSVALLDVYLGDGNGIEVCRDIRAADPEIRCLMLTHATADEPLLDSIIAGAAGYLQKTITPQELIDAVRIVASGRSLIEMDLMARALKRIRNQGEDCLSRLTKREGEVLQLISQGLSNQDIAERLCLMDQTVKNYVSRVLAKLEMGRIQAALYAAQANHDQDTER